MKRVRVVKTYLDVGQDIKSLESSVANLKSSLNYKEEEENVKDIDTDMILKNAKSMTEVTDQVYQFEYEEFKDGGAVICGACEQVFKYSRDLKDDFTDNSKVAREFSNLKTSLRRHLKSEMHNRKTRKVEENDIVKKKEDVRNAVVGVRIGKLVYHLVKLGRPDTDFTSLVQISASNGADLGDKNHSKYFVTKLLPHLADAVKRRWKKVLDTPMVATGCRPPVCVVADKATHQRETRQLVGVITLNPGGTQLLIPVFLGGPKCPRGDGEYLKNSIVGVVDKFVEGSQIAGFTGDGVYIHCDVAQKINEHFDISCFSTWDQMHLANTVETALRNPKKAHAPLYAWLNALTNVLGKGVKFVAWGMEWDHFFRVCQELSEQEDFELKMYRPTNFSETKFANSAAIVYNKFREVYPALVITLEQVKEDLYNGNSTEREKAKKADDVQAGILNYMFGLSLYVCVGIYKIYGAISNILQIIDILPHDRMDLFYKLIRQMKDMKANLIVEDCPCMMFVSELGVVEDFMTNKVASDKEKVETCKGILAEVCLWPALHKDIREVLVKGSYRGVVLGQLTGDSSRT